MRLLNALLMGKTPEGDAASTPGFMIIGTQNPITMDGRRAASTAMARRTTTLQMPPYTREETHAILLSKGLTNEVADDMVRAYETQQTYAKSHCLTPEPTFRDLMRLTKRVAPVLLHPPLQYEEQKEESKENPFIRPISLLAERQTALEKETQACLHYLQLIKEMAWGTPSTDPKTHDFCEKIQASITKPAIARSFNTIHRRLQLLKDTYAAVTSTEMMMIRAEVEKWEKKSQGFFNTGNNQIKANKIKQAVCDVDLIDRGGILSNKESLACQVVREALGDDFEQSHAKTHSYKRS